MPKVLIIDDEESICWGLKQIVSSLGADPTICQSVEQALGLPDSFVPSLIVLDVRLPGMDGLSGMLQFREKWEGVPIIIMTAFGDLETAVKAVRHGAFQYVIKPFDTQTIRKAIEQGLAAGASSLTSPSEPSPPTRPDRSAGTTGLIAQTPVMQEVFNRIALASHSDAAVLVTGESGTGKELAARAIHRFSRRATAPLVVVNVAALSPSLAESELFGHVKGAFTGADQNRHGLLKQAHQGTLFLDEVAEIPLPLQVKLLRAVEQKEFTPVGSNEPVPSDFRIIAATHQDLPRLIAEGEFRQDLFFRLAAFTIELPPLRKRIDDLIPLAEFFLEQFAGSGRTPPELSPAAITQLQQRSWPGNVRELRNVLEHAIILSRGRTIHPEHLPPDATQTQGTRSSAQQTLEHTIHDLLRQWTSQALDNPAWDGQLYEQLLALVERPVFEALLEKNQGQVLPAARTLGLHRTTLRRKLDQFRGE